MCAWRGSGRHRSGGRGLRTTTSCAGGPPRRSGTEGRIAHMFDSRSQEPMTIERITTAEVAEEERALESTVRPRRLDEFAGQDRIKENLAILIDAAQQARRAGRPRPPLRPAGPRQDDAREHRGRRDGRADPHDFAARPSSAPATWRRCSRASAAATSCSSTRSIGSAMSSRRSSTRRWRTSRSTSCSARAPARGRCGSRSRR